MFLFWPNFCNVATKKKSNVTFTKDFCQKKNKTKSPNFKEMFFEITVSLDNGFRQVVKMP